MEMETVTREHKASQDQKQFRFRAGTDLTIGLSEESQSKNTSKRNSKCEPQADEENDSNKGSESNVNTVKRQSTENDEKNMTMPVRQNRNSFLKNTNGSAKDPKWKSGKISGLPFKKRVKLEPRKSNLESYQKLKVQRTREYSMNKRLHEKYRQGDIKKNQKDTLSDFQKVNEQNTGLVQNNLAKQKSLLRDRIRSRREKSISKARSRTLKSMTQIELEGKVNELDKRGDTSMRLAREDESGRLMVPGKQRVNVRKESDGDELVEEGDMLLGMGETIDNLKNEIMKDNDKDKEDEEGKYENKDTAGNDNFQNGVELESKNENCDHQDIHEKAVFRKNPNCRGVVDDDLINSLKHEIIQKDTRAQIEDQAQGGNLHTNEIIEIQDEGHKISKIETPKSEESERSKENKAEYHEVNEANIAKDSITKKHDDIPLEMAHSKESRGNAKEIANKAEIELQTVVSIISNEIEHTESENLASQAQCESIKNLLTEKPESKTENEIEPTTNSEKLESLNLNAVKTPEKSNNTHNNGFKEPNALENSPSEQNDLILTGEPILAVATESGQNNFPSLDLQGRNIQDLLTPKLAQDETQAPQFGNTNIAKSKDQKNKEQKQKHLTGNQPASNSIGGVDCLETGSSINTGAKTLEGQSKRDSIIKQKEIILTQRQNENLHNSDIIGQNPDNLEIQNEAALANKLEHEKNKPTSEAKIVLRQSQRLVNLLENQNFCKKEGNLNNLLNEGEPKKKIRRAGDLQNIDLIMDQIGQNPPLKTPKQKRKLNRKSKRKIGSKRKVPLINSYSKSHQKESGYGSKNVKSKTERDSKRRKKRVTAPRRSNFSGANMAKDPRARKSVNAGLPRKVCYIIIIIKN